MGGNVERGKEGMYRIPRGIQVGPGGFREYFHAFSHGYKMSRKSLFHIMKRPPFTSITVPVM